MAYFLHIESEQPIILSNEHVKAYVRKCEKSNDIRDYVLPLSEGTEVPVTQTKYMPGNYTLLPRVHKHYFLAQRFVITKDTLNILHSRGDQWRTRETHLAGKYQALVIYPNEGQYWKELLCKVCMHPDKYPAFTDMDKLLFTLTCNDARFFQHNLHACPDTHRAQAAYAGDTLGRDATKAHLAPPPRKVVPPIRGICYAKEHYQEAWRVTLTQARAEARARKQHNAA